MTEGAPTLDRLFAGLMAGAAVGAAIVTLYLTVSAIVIGSEFPIDAWQVVGTLLGFFLALGLAMLLLQTPLWWLLRALRMRDWVAATLAGGLAFVGPVGLVTAWLDHSEPPRAAETAVLLVSWAVVGLVAGFVAWRVARFAV